MRRNWPLLIYVVGFACTFLDRVPRWSDAAWCSFAGVALALAGVVVFVSRAAREGRRAFRGAALTAAAVLLVGGFAWYRLQAWVPNYDPVRDACAFLVERGFTARRAWWLGSGTATAFEKDGVLFVAKADAHGFAAAFSGTPLPDAGDEVRGRGDRDDHVADLRRIVASRAAPNYPFADVLRLDPASAAALDAGLARCERVPLDRRRAAYSALLAELLRAYGTPYLEGDFRRLAPLDSAYVDSCRAELARLERAAAPPSVPAR